MKLPKPVVDYRKLRPNNINTPEFAHLKYLLGWVGYLVLYFVTENLIPYERCTPIHIALDDMVPFDERWVIFYTFWYLFLVGSLLIFVLYDVKSFTKLQIFIIITQVVAMTVYIVFPNRQDLRPEVFPRDNFLTDVIAFIYSFDTNTGVCPSLHVAYSVGIGSVWSKKKDAPVWWKVLCWFFVVMISLSTAFVKQHSVADIFAGAALGIVTEIAVYGKDYWLPKLRGKRTARG